MESTGPRGFTCQACGDFISGPEMHWHTPENCLRHQISVARAQLAAANEMAGRYKSALRLLVNEVGVSAGAFEDEVRDAVGGINYARLMGKVERARKVLDGQAR